MVVPNKCVCVCGGGGYVITNGIIMTIVCLYLPDGLLVCNATSSTKCSTADEILYSVHPERRGTCIIIDFKAT